MTSDITKTPFVGVLMLDTAFPRMQGDAGNMRSYDFPARVKVVCGAGSLDIVQGNIIPEHLSNAFCLAAREMEALGAAAIVPTCGFLITSQERIASHSNDTLSARSTGVKVTGSMSELGQKQTSVFAEIGSAFGFFADIRQCTYGSSNAYDSSSSTEH